MACSRSASSAPRLAVGCFPVLSGLDRLPQRAGVGRIVELPGLLTLSGVRVGRERGVSGERGSRQHRRSGWP